MIHTVIVAVKGRKPMFPRFRYLGPYLFAFLLIVAGWYTLLRNPCHEPHVYAQSAWGGAAWHSGMHCPRKEWWRP